jgi:hypothetical protein
MPGGGGLKAANHMYAVARPDGLTIGSVNATGMLGAAVFGGVGVKYDMQRFIYLGSPNGSAQSLFYTRKEIGISNLEKLRATSGSESPRRQSVTTTTTSAVSSLTW